MTDARFEDGAERPMHLVARDADDLAVISALVQDAVFPATDMTWDRRARRFGVLLTRFQWEDRAAAEAERRAYQRVRALLWIDDVLAVQTHGIDRRADDTVLSLLSMAFEPGADGAGRLVMTLAGDGAVAVEVEALEVSLRDVTRPHIAVAARAPDHPDR